MTEKKGNAQKRCDFSVRKIENEKQNQTSTV